MDELTQEEQAYCSEGKCINMAQIPPSIALCADHLALHLSQRRAKG